MAQLLRNIRTVLLLISFCWLAGLLWFTTLIPPDTSASAATADTIVVLTGGSMRLEHGFELLAQGRAPRMFISGVEDGITLDSLLHKKEFSAFTDKIPTGSVELGSQARTTIGNAEETALWVSQNRVKSILLVTGNYHIPRSSYELHEAMPGVTIIPEPVFPSYFAHNEWWKHTDSIRLVISEYNKYITSILVYTLLVKS